MNAVATLARRRGTAPADLVSKVTKTLASGTWGDRRVAALALGQLGSGADTSALIKAAGDSSSFVREAVATALGQIGGSTAVVDTLLTLSRDEIAQVRAAAARALGSSRDERASRRRAELANDPEEVVRAAAGGTP